MLSIGKSNRYFFYARDADMRKGFDGLCGLVSNEFLQNPLSGDVFIFLSRRRSRIKLLQFQGDGFAIFSKRLEKGTYEIPLFKINDPCVNLSTEQLLFILQGVVLKSVKKKLRYAHSYVENV